MSFQKYINDILHEYLNKFCTAYLNNILIYSNNEAEHKIHIKYIFQKLKKTVRVLDHGRNNKGSMLIYNLAAMKNSKIKMFTQDKSGEKQRNSVKTTLIAPELV